MNYTYPKTSNDGCQHILKTMLVIQQNILSFACSLLTFPADRWTKWSYKVHIAKSEKKIAFRASCFSSDSLEIRWSQSTLCPVIKTHMKRGAAFPELCHYRFFIRCSHVRSTCPNPVCWVGMATCGLGAVSNLCYFYLNLWTLCQTALFGWIDW